MVIKLKGRKNWIQIKAKKVHIGIVAWYYVCFLLLSYKMLVNNLVFKMDKLNTGLLILPPLSLAMLYLKKLETLLISKFAITFWQTPKCNGIFDKFRSTSSAVIFIILKHTVLVWWWRIFLLAVPDMPHSHMWFGIQFGCKYYAIPLEIGMCAYGTCAAIVREANRWRWNNDWTINASVSHARAHARGHLAPRQLCQWYCVTNAQVAGESY